MGTRFTQLFQEGLDANNTATVSNSSDIAENTHVSVFILAAGGAHDIHIMTLQCSPDDTNWSNTVNVINQDGFVDNIQVTGRYVRLKVSQAEGDTSLVNVYIQGKG